jgi:hypothetical protein
MTMGLAFFIDLIRGNDGQSSKIKTTYSPTSDDRKRSPWEGLLRLDRFEAARARISTSRREHDTSKLPARPARPPERKGSVFRAQTPRRSAGKRPAIKQSAITINAAMAKSFTAARTFPAC